MIVVVRIAVVLLFSTAAVARDDLVDLFLVCISSSVFGCLMIVAGLAVPVWMWWDWQVGKRRDKLAARQRQVWERRRAHNRLGRRACTTPPLPRQRTREGVR